MLDLCYLESIVYDMQVSFHKKFSIENCFAGRETAYIEFALNHHDLFYDRFLLIHVCLCIQKEDGAVARYFFKDKFCLLSDYKTKINSIKVVFESKDIESFLSSDIFSWYLQKQISIINEKRCNTDFKFCERNVL